MKETTCNNGHIYDSDLYASCPYCNGNTRTISFEGEDYPPHYDEPRSYSGVERTRQEENDYDPVWSTGVGKTRMDEGWYNGFFGSGNYNGRTVAPRGFFNEDTTMKTVAPRGFFDTEKERKTVAPEDFCRSDRENRGMQGFYSYRESRNTTFPGGWLVCIDGQDRGKDFRVLCCVNTIGRSQSMDIRINDPSVYDGNARLAYDQRINEFSLLPAEKSNNIYLNGKVVLMPTQLRAFDQIEFGRSRMLFVPLCGERFCWGNNSGVSDDR